MIEIARVERAMVRHGQRFFERFFTPRELAEAGGRAASLAARIAAKEAAAKALGCGIGDVRWKDIEIVHDARRRPQVALHGPAAALAEALGLREWSVSLSHTQEHALAFAVAAGPDQTSA